MKLLFANAFKNVWKGLIQLISAIVLIFLAVAIFTVTNSTNSVLTQGYNTLKNNVRFRSASSNLESNYNYVFHTNLDKLKKGDKTFLVYNDSVNQLFFGPGDNGRGTLPKLYDEVKGYLSLEFNWLKDPANATLNADKTAWIVDRSKKIEFERATFNYFRPLTQILNDFTAVDETNDSLQGLLTQYYFGTYENGKHLNELATKNVNDTGSIDYRAFFSLRFSNNITKTDNTFVVVKANDDIDVSYPYYSNADLGENEALVSQNYLNNNKFKAGTINDNSRTTLTIDNVNDKLALRGVGYTADFVAPASSGAFGFGFFDSTTSTTAIVNSSTFYILANSALNNSITSFVDLSYNPSYDSHIVTSQLNSFFSQFTIGKNVINLTNNSESFQKAFYNGDNPEFSFNAGLDSLKTSTANTNTFNFIIMLIILIVAGIVILFIIRRRVEDVRGQLGVLKANGYNSWEISASFCLFPIIASFFGCLIGYGVGALIGFFLNGSATQNFLGPFPNFAFDWVPLVLPLLVAIGLLSLVAFFTALFILRGSARALMSPGSTISVGRIATYVQRLFTKARFETKFRWSFIVSAPIKNLVVFLSFMFSSFLLLFAIFLSSIFSNVVDNTFNGVNFGYNYTFLQNDPNAAREVSAFGRYRLLNHDYYQSDVRWMLSGDGTKTPPSYGDYYADSTLGLRDVTGVGKTIYFKGPDNEHQKSAIFGLLANSGLFYNKDGTLANDEKGFLGLYFDWQSFAGPFANTKYPQSNWAQAWLYFLDTQFDNWLYGDNPSTNTMPIAAHLKLIEDQYNGSDDQHKFLGTRTLDFSNFANTDYGLFVQTYLPKLVYFIGEGVNFYRTDHTVNFGVGVYDTAKNNDLPYLSYSSRFRNAGYRTNLTMQGFSQIGTNKIDNYFDYIHQADLDKLQYHPDTGTLDVYLNQGGLRALRAKVGQTVSAGYLKVVPTDTNKARYLRLHIMGVYNGYIQSFAYSKYSALVDALSAAAKPDATNLVNADGVNVANIIRPPNSSVAPFYDGFYSKATNNQLTSNIPLYYEYQTATVTQYGFAFAAIVSLNDIKQLLNTIQTLFTILLTVIIAFTCVISLMIIIALTSIVIAENRTSISIMKLMGYSDTKINWLFISVYFVIIILAMLASIGFVFLTFSILTNYFYNTLNLAILVSYPIWAFFVDLAVLLSLFMFSFLLTWFAVKRVGLLDIIGQDE